MNRKSYTIPAIIMAWWDYKMRSCMIQLKDLNRGFVLFLI